MQQNNEGHRANCIERQCITHVETFEAYKVEPLVGTEMNSLGNEPLKWTGFVNRQILINYGLCLGSGRIDYLLSRQKSSRNRKSRTRPETNLFIIP